MRFLAILGVWAAALPALAHANVQVLGFEIGVTTAEQVKAQLAKQIGKHEVITNNFTGGPQFRTNGAGYGISGLTSVSYIFDKAQKLAGVVMEMSKSSFNETFATLSAKYKLVSRNPPGRDALFARFEAREGTIELDRSLQGMDMQARYFRSDVYQKLALVTEREAHQRRAAALVCCIDP